MHQNKIFLLLTGQNLSENIIHIKDNLEYIRGVELRLDFLSLSLADEEWEAFANCLIQNSLELLVTLRNKADGGLFSGTEEELSEKYRLVVAKLSAFIPSFYIDIAEPHLSLARELKGTGHKVLLSFHDFNGLPDNLEDRLNFIIAKGFIPKAACMLNSTSDLVGLIKVADSLRGKEKVLLGMGVVGLPTRILQERMGSLWSYASCEPVQTQLGQLSPQTMCELYQYYHINKTTRINGVIGNPIMHSKSPVIHNGGYKRDKINAVYLPFLVDDLFTFQELAALLPIYGLSITIPFKEEFISFLTKINPEVKAIGACNTAVRSQNENGSVSWEGFNTDYLGFANPLKEWLKNGTDNNKNRCAAVIGAGGAARGVVWALHMLGFHVHIFNRTKETALLLAKELGEAGVDALGYGLSDLKEYSGQFTVVAQTSSAGMGKMSDLDPSEGYSFSGDEIAFDIVYDPEETLFMKRAKEAGCKVLGGLAMLESQAKGQYMLFTR